MWNPDDHAHRLGLRVIDASLPDDHGRYYQEARLIVLREGLTPVTRRCMLGHELGHVRFGDTTSSEQIEARAWRWAANRLVSVDDVVACALAHPERPDLWCEQLQVTPHVLRTWLSQPRNYQTADEQYRRAA